MQSADIIEYSLELSSLKKRSVTYPKYPSAGCFITWWTKNQTSTGVLS